MIRLESKKEHTMDISEESSNFSPRKTKYQLNMPQQDIL
jgi:hypothetical protein